MSEQTQPAPPRWLAWMPAFALMGTVIAALLTGGGYISTQAEQGRRIEALERREERITDIRERTIRIEARLDALVPADRKDDR